MTLFYVLAMLAFIGAADAIKTQLQRSSICNFSCHLTQILHAGGLIDSCLIEFLVEMGMNMYSNISYLHILKYKYAQIMNIHA